MHGLVGAFVADQLNPPITTFISFLLMTFMYFSSFQTRDTKLGEDPLLLRRVTR